MSGALTKFPAQIGKLIRMLDSDNDGECLCAARAIGRALRSVGNDLHGLAAFVERGGGDRGGGRDHDQEHDHGPHDWRSVVRWCRAREAMVNDWESDFLAGLAGWVGKPTQRQLHRLEVIFNKLGRRP